MRTRHINREVVLKKMAGKPIEVYSFFSGAGFWTWALRKQDLISYLLMNLINNFWTYINMLGVIMKSYHSMVIVMRTLEFFVR